MQKMNLNLVDGIVTLLALFAILYSKYPLLSTIIVVTGLLCLYHLAYIAVVGYLYKSGKIVDAEVEDAPLPELLLEKEA